MKLVTAFVGSARKRGFTAGAARQLLDRLESFGDVRGEIVFLSDCDIGVCRGCKACFMRGEEHCPMRGDDRDALIAKMMASDGVVFATPVYSFQVSAILKNFLDRLGFVFHRPQFHGRAFTCLAVQGFYGGEKVVRYLEFVGRGLGFNVAPGTCLTALEPMSQAERRKADATLARQGRRFHELLSRPALPTPSFFQLLGFRTSRMAARWTLGENDRDFTYYRDHGWFDSDYFYPTRLGPLKKAAGAAFDWWGTRVYRNRERQ